MMEKYGGRKFTLTCVGVFLMIILPIVYEKLGISEVTTQLVLGAIAGAIGAYGVTNVLADKYYKPEVNK